MVKEMLSIAKTLVPDGIYGFHIPPFNSINHLHLHVLKRPFKSFWRGWKYPTRVRVPWFVSGEGLIASLETGKDLGLKGDWNGTWPKNKL